MKQATIYFVLLVLSYLIFNFTPYPMVAFAPLVYIVYSIVKTIKRKIDEN